MISPLELAANVLLTLATLLAGRNSVHSWWTGIVGCALFAALFYQARLYADVALQLFFIVTCAIGWWKWLHGDHGSALPVSHANFASLAWTLPVAIAASGGYGMLLHFYTNAYSPFIDSTVLVLSVIAQVLLMQRRIENWAFWLVVNAVATPLYASRGLYLTAFLSVVYFFNAIVAWRWWRKLAGQAGRVPPAELS